MSESNNETKGFKITDRRAFTSEGERRSDEKTTPEMEHQEPGRSEKPIEGEEKPTADTSAGGKRPVSSADEPGPPPNVGFMDLVNMLATNALMQLGDVSDPESGENVENLQGVQVMIAFLATLQQKTKGNLDKDEAKVLDDVLYDLRMRFMARADLLKR